MGFPVGENILHPSSFPSISFLQRRGALAAGASSVLRHRCLPAASSQRPAARAGTQQPSPSVLRPGRTNSGPGHGPRAQPSLLPQEHSAGAALLPGRACRRRAEPVAPRSGYSALGGCETPSVPPSSWWDAPPPCPARCGQAPARARRFSTRSRHRSRSSCGLCFPKPRPPSPSSHCCGVKGCRASL